MEPNNAVFVRYSCIHIVHIVHTHIQHISLLLCKLYINVNSSIHPFVRPFVRPSVCMFVRPFANSQTNSSLLFYEDFTVTIPTVMTNLMSEF